MQPVLMQPVLMQSVGAFTVAVDHPSRAGHFPGNPVVPGVVLLDEAAALILRAAPGQVLGGFPSVRFSRPVRFGDTVAVSHDGSAFACSVDGKPVLRGSIVLRPV